MLKFHELSFDGTKEQTHPRQHSFRYQHTTRDGAMSSLCFLNELSFFVHRFFLFCSLFIRRRLRQPGDDECKNSSIPFAKVMKRERTRTLTLKSRGWMWIGHNNKEDPYKVIHRPWNLSSKSVSRVSYRDKRIFFFWRAEALMDFAIDGYEKEYI